MEFTRGIIQTQVIHKYKLTKALVTQQPSLSAPECEAERNALHWQFES